MNQQDTWTAVDHYFNQQLIPSDPVLEAVLAANAAAGLPAHDVSPNQGKLLHLLAKLQAARTILEIGTLGGYSTIWFARALPQDGRVYTLEASLKHAEVAQSNLLNAGVADKVEIRTGLAADSLAQLEEEARGPFDLIFIDADKQGNPEYLKWALKLSRPGTLIIGDNVVRGGAVVDEYSDDPSVLGVRSFFELIAAEPRLNATAIQTVGSKGYDGFVSALVVGK
ncbi:O-methyltransferase [Paenibacillus sp. MER 180]|uniref:O-methyltransferase n=1 Tax=Paenibacillus sp. MER 180 TaxID=2939570 RepID=UPI00203B829E|nr:O-methyltransferase [Paenibacillus sp. MER 180]MCM3290373.1 O-methyltransferase [Paenibacillus sp. MER 180]